MWLILNKEFYYAELKDCRAVSAYDDLDKAILKLEEVIKNA